jgi:hypothetical protein
MQECFYFFFIIPNSEDESKNTFIASRPTLVIPTSFRLLFQPARLWREQSSGI